MGQIWHAGVEIAIRETGDFRFVASTEEAKECLIYRWPVAYGRQWLAAQKACADALEGRIPPPRARNAFI
jgi:hypothetical protein